MKNKILVSIAIFVLFSTTFFIFIPPLRAQENAGTILSKAFKGNINLDGKNEDSDWQVVTPRSYTLYEYSTPTIEREMEIASIHNGTILFLWISVDETEPFDLLFLIFQSNANGSIVIDHNVPTWSEGNDIKHIYGNNITSDRYMSSNMMSASEDVSQDFDGKIFTRTGGIDFEFAIPLDSGDTNGGDISLVEGDSINMFPTYMSEGASSSNIFTLIQSTDGVWEQIRIDLEVYSFWKIPSYSIPILIFSMLAVSMFLIFKFHLKK